MALIAVDVSSGTWTGLENIRVIELDDREVQGLDFKSDSEIIGLGNAGEIPIVPFKHYAKAEMILEWLDEQEFTRSEDENRVYDLSVKMANAHALLAVADASRITEQAAERARDGFTDTQVQHDVAANLIAYARQIDPGVGDKRGHWIAYGIRHALIEVGLYPAQFVNGEDLHDTE